MTSSRTAGYYWTCQQCQTANPGGVVQCRACGTAKVDRPMTAAVMPSRVEIRTYREATAEASANAFALDAAEAERFGWTATSHTWDGPSLTVVYQPGRGAAGQARRRRVLRLPTVRLGIPRFGKGIAIGGLLMGLGALLPWIEASAAFAVLRRGGLDGLDGMAVLVIAGILVIAGVATRRDDRAWLVALVAALAGLGAGLLGFWDANSQISAASEAIGARIGIGLWLSLAGAIVSLVSSVLAYFDARR